MVAVTLISPPATEAAPPEPQLRDVDAATTALNPAAGLMLATLLSVLLWGLIYAVVRLAAA